MNWKKLWRKTYRTMAQTLIPLVPTTWIMFEELDWKLIIVAVLGSGVVCFLSGIVDDDNLGVDEEGDEDDI